ncbi:hypothetical protein NPIL_457551 [Nephila pilipes]|uniref:Uncharacterized protein n=1 Tax=Nephila pilipes TaxID=299642 RepID=A0A8X6MH52_NEPPI|nr:hypothetical protein NPIL_457551 [Nephila pilipes]
MWIFRAGTFWEPSFYFRSAVLKNSVFPQRSRRIFGDHKVVRLCNLRDNRSVPFSRVFLPWVSFSGFSLPNRVSDLNGTTDRLSAKRDSSSVMVSF